MAHGALLPRGAPRAREAAAPRKAPQQQPVKEKPVTHLTPFLHSEIVETLTQTELLPEPLWSSWCGHAAGVWVGLFAAYAPTTGLPETIAMGGEKNKTKLFSLQQCCVEERETIDDEDVMVRRTARATSAPQLEREMAAGGALKFDATESLDWEVEEMVQEQDGLFIFDGGSYSMGALDLLGEEEEEEIKGEGDVMGVRGEQQPLQGEQIEEVELLEYIEEEEDAIYLNLDDESAPPQGCTTVIENCLQWGGDQRVRIKLTLSSLLSYYDAVEAGKNADAVPSAPPSLDINLLRVAVAREGWEGAPGRYTSPSQSPKVQAAQEKSASKRLRPKDMAGFWNVFEIVAKTVVDVDMRTGEPAAVNIYTSREVQRLVQLPRKSFEGIEGEEGGILLLPHNVAVQLTQGGLSSGGLKISIFWMPKDGVVVGMSRRFDSMGKLEEVVSSSAVRAK